MGWGYRKQFENKDVYLSVSLKINLWDSDSHVIRIQVGTVSLESSPDVICSTDKTHRITDAVDLGYLFQEVRTL